jgi:hypothetical protein
MAHLLENLSTCLILCPFGVFTLIKIVDVDLFVNTFIYMFKMFILMSIFFGVFIILKCVFILC